MIFYVQNSKFYCDILALKGFFLWHGMQNHYNSKWPICIFLHHSSFVLPCILFLGAGQQTLRKQKYIK